MAEEDQGKIIKPDDAWLGYPKIWMNAFRSMQKMQNAPFMMYLKAFEVVITPEKLGMSQETSSQDTISEDNEMSFTNAWEKSRNAAEDELAKGMTEAWQRYWLSFTKEMFNQYAKMYQAFALPWMSLPKSN